MRQFPTRFDLRRLHIITRTKINHTPGIKCTKFDFYKGTWAASTESGQSTWGWTFEFFLWFCFLPITDGG
jgi:hypothetical protein